LAALISCISVTSSITAIPALVRKLGEKRVLPERSARYL